MSDVFEMINGEVSIWDLLESVGVEFPTRERSLKVSCPWHADARKSGYVYHDTNTYRCYACNTSWDPISFWAQANDWYKPNPKDPSGDQVLDMGKSIASLKDKYNIEYVRPEWETRFRELKDSAKPPRGYEDFPMAERVKMAQLYVWGISRDLFLFTREDRAASWDQIRSLLDEAEDLDLTAPTWKSDLNKWRECATLVVESRGKA